MPKPTTVTNDPPVWTPLPIKVVAYDSTWPAIFEEIRARIAFAMGNLALAIEHVGSTAVPGLAAKPIIDIDVVIRSRDDLPATIERLAVIGYIHRGELPDGPPGCEAFHRPPDAPIHHLFVCPQDNQQLRKHLAFRDYLRTHPDARTEYASLKRALAARFSNDRESYTRSKTDLIERMLVRAQRRDEVI